MFNQTPCFNGEAIFEQVRTRFHLQLNFRLIQTELWGSWKEPIFEVFLVFWLHINLFHWKSHRNARLLEKICYRILYYILNLGIQITTKKPSSLCISFLLSTKKQVQCRRPGLILYYITQTYWLKLPVELNSLVNLILKLNRGIFSFQTFYFLELIIL